MGAAGAADAEGQTDGGEREEGREGREHLRISLKKPSEKESEGGRRRTGGAGGAQVFGLEMQLLNVRIELSCSARERKRETGRERNCLGDVSPSPQPREGGRRRTTNATREIMAQITGAAAAVGYNKRGRDTMGTRVVGDCRLYVLSIIQKLGL